MNDIERGLCVEDRVQRHVRRRGEDSKRVVHRAGRDGVGFQMRREHQAGAEPDV